MIAAIGITIWRFDTSRTFADGALADQRQISAVESLNDLLLDRSSVFIANRPLTSAETDGLSGSQTRFAQILTAQHAAIEHEGDRVETRMLDRVEAVNARLIAAERATTPILGTAAGLSALEKLRRQQPAVNHALDPFFAHAGADAAAAQTRSVAAHLDAVAMGITVGALAVILAIALVAYVVVLLRRSFGRIRADSKLLEERLREVETARVETLARLALAAEHRDEDTLQHTERVARVAALIAARMELEPTTVELIRLAAPLHDVGKLGVSDTILLKPGRLTEPEMDVMKGHTTAGAAILAWSGSPVLQMAEQIALAHHERWDGSGYPSGLASDAIPIAARIVAIADVFDALTHDRPYKQAWPLAEALAEMAKQAGHHFDPRLVTAFLSISPSITFRSLATCCQRSRPSSRPDRTLSALLCTDVLAEEGAPPALGRLKNARVADPLPVVLHLLGLGCSGAVLLIVSAIRPARTSSAERNQHAVL